MKVLFNPSVNNRNYKYQTKSFSGGNIGEKTYTIDEIRTAKLKKAVSIMSLLAVSVGIVYFGFKKGAKVNRIAIEQKKQEEFEKMVVPEIDKRVLDIIKPGN